MEFNKYIHANLNEIELKKYAKDIADNILFTDRHIGSQSDLKMVFMPLMFLSCHSSKKIESRKDKLEWLLTEMEKTEYFKSKGFKDEEEAFNAYLDDIGTIMEYYSKSHGGSINGNPIFYSCILISKSDSVKLWGYAKNYNELKNKLEQDFLNK